MLEVSNLRYSYQDRLVFSDASFSAYPGQVVVIFGVSGVGKTTLFRLISQFLVPEEGTIFWQGRPIIREEISYMQQRHQLLPWRTVEKNISLSLELGKKKREISPEKIKRVLSYFQIQELLSRYPDTLSEGQKQRVSLACHCVLDKPLLLLDEPFSSLDLLTKEALYTCVLHLAEQGKTIVLVTHDVRDAACLGHAFYMIKGTKIWPMDIDPTQCASASWKQWADTIRGCL